MSSELEPTMLAEDVPGPSTSPASKESMMLSSVVIDAENYFLRQEIIEKAKEIKKLSTQFSYDHIKDDNRLILLYTGLPNAELFDALCELLEGIEIEYYYKWNVTKINKKDQLLLTLMKLRQNFPHADLAQRFRLSISAVSNIIVTWIYVLHKILYQQLMATIPKRSKNKSCLPNCFSSFTNSRIILDCTEVYTAVPRKSMNIQKATYSSYKHRNTWKALVGVAPNGVVTFLSGLYPGSTSDKKITQNCGILTQLEPGDLVLADKGFLIQDILPAGVHLNIPPFLSTPQFTEEQVHQTQSIARARIHVERAIQRIKCFKILNFIPRSLVTHAQKVFQVVNQLTNLQYPLINEVEQLFVEMDD